MGSCVACDYRVSTEYFGHRIMPFIFRRLLDRPVALAQAGEAAVFGSGSNLSRVAEGALIWGAGFSEATSTVPAALKSARILGLRGRLSAEIAGRSGANPPGEIPLGNAWEVIPGCFPEPAEKEFDFGVLAHPRDLSHPFVTSCESAGGCFISPFDDLESVVESLRRCRAVLTTSLEGLMLCDAFGIPSRWIRIERPREISDFPIRDYLSGRVTDDGSEDPEPVHHFWDYRELVAKCRVRKPSPGMPRLSLDSLEASRDALPERECPVFFSSPEERRRRPIPIFVISFNRLDCLRRLIDSVRRSTLPVEVVIHDNGSDYPPLLKYLEELEKSGIHVARNPKLEDNPKGLEQINDTIDWYFRDFSEPIPYVVTDPDISFENSDPAFLELYRDLLDRFPGVECVGPQLPIDDIPESFPLRHWVIQRQKHYWKSPPDQYFRWRDRDVYLRTNTVIDTTFALFRPGARFKRLAKAIRVYAPFDARHLDWYQVEPDDEMRHYQRTASDISHWQGEYSREDRYRDFRLGPTTIFVTRPEDATASDLQIRRIEI